MISVTIVIDTKKGETMTIKYICYSKKHKLYIGNWKPVKSKASATKFHSLKDAKYLIKIICSSFEWENFKDEDWEIKETE